MSGKEQRLNLFIIVFIILIANSISAQRLSIASNESEARALLIYQSDASQGYILLSSKVYSKKVIKPIAKI